MKLRPWTTVDEQLLREWYAKVGAAECSLMLDRSQRAVWTRAYRLGLTESDPSKAQRFSLDLHRMVGAEMARRREHNRGMTR